MPIVKKPKTISQPFSAAQVAAAKAAASKEPASKTRIDWSNGVVTPGGGVAATVAAVRRTRGPNKRPAKEQVAIRLDPDVLGAFRAGGPGWQTRMNAALKEWLASHPAKPRARGKSAV
jgi:uncharacterized protein (DUF4415 family)